MVYPTQHCKTHMKAHKINLLFTATDTKGAYLYCNVLRQVAQLHEIGKVTLVKTPQTDSSELEKVCKLTKIKLEAQVKRLPLCIDYEPQRFPLVGIKLCHLVVPHKGQTWLLDYDIAVIRPFPVLKRGLYAVSQAWDTELQRVVNKKHYFNSGVIGLCDWEGYSEERLLLELYAEKRYFSDEITQNKLFNFKEMPCKNLLGVASTSLLCKDATFMHFIGQNKPWSGLAVHPEQVKFVKAWRNSIKEKPLTLVFTLDKEAEVPQIQRALRNITATCSQDFDVILISCNDLGHSNLENKILSSRSVTTVKSRIKSFRFLHLQAKMPELGSYGSGLYCKILAPYLLAELGVTRYLLCDYDILFLSDIALLWDFCQAALENPQVSHVAHRCPREENGVFAGLNRFCMGLVAVDVAKALLCKLEDAVELLKDCANCGMPDEMFHAKVFAGSTEAMPETWNSNHYTSDLVSCVHYRGDHKPEGKALFCDELLCVFGEPDNKVAVPWRPNSVHSHTPKYYDAALMCDSATELSAKLTNTPPVGSAASCLRPVITVKKEENNVFTVVPAGKRAVLDVAAHLQNSALLSPAASKQDAVLLEAAKGSPVEHGILAGKHVALAGKVAKTRAKQLTVLVDMDNVALLPSKIRKDAVVICENLTQEYRLRLLGRGFYFRSWHLLPRGSTAGTDQQKGWNLRQCKRVGKILREDGTCPFGLCDNCVRWFGSFAKQH